MRLGLITPALNQARYLERCMARLSALGVEHVVADGGSGDGSLELLEQTIRARASGFKYISEADRGMYDGLNRGMALCDAEVVGYINCDDALLPWGPRMILDRFAADPSLDLLVGDVLEIEGDRVSCGVQPPARVLLGSLEAGQLLAQPAVFFRRRLYERLGGFDPRFKLLGDHDFFCRALAANVHVERLWEVIAVQRLVAGRLMQRFRSTALAERAQIHRDRGWQTPTPLSLWAARALAAGLRRAALLSCASPGVGPWRALSGSGLVRVTSKGNLLRSLVSTTRGKRILELTEHGRAELDVDLFADPP